MGKDIGGELEELALRVEALQGPDREVDARIWCHLQGWKWIKKIAHKSPDGRPAFFAFRCSDGDKSVMGALRFTASFDAAMSLAPESAWLHCFFRTGVLDYVTMGIGDDGVEYKGRAHSPALALTAAALRSRARLAAPEE